MLRLTIINYKTIAKGAEVYLSHMGQAFAPGFSFADAPVKQLVLHSRLNHRHSEHG